MVIGGGAAAQRSSGPTRRPRLDLLASARGRRALFGALYFTEGAPIGFVWWTLPVLLRRQGVGPDVIGALTGLLVLPWAFKFVWAPLVDVLRGPWFGLRAWIVTSQVVMVASLLPLAWIDLGRELGIERHRLLVPLLRQGDLHVK